jgi:GDP-L-fucose synthase
VKRQPDVESPASVAHRSAERLDLRGRRVLVTGGHGFLGKHLVAVLEARGAVALPVRRQEADLCDRRAVEALFAREEPELVVHAAAVGGGIGWMKDHPATAHSGNAAMALAVLDVACSRNVRRLVGVSSACAYAREAAQPMREEHIWEGEPESTNAPYGHAKRLLMRHGAALHAEFGFDCAFVVPTNLYGPGESFDPTRAHVVGALVRRFEEARREGAADVRCWGSGRATRDLLFVRDAAELTVRLLERGGGPAPVNAGSGVERSIAAIAGAVAEACGYAGAVSWDVSMPDGMPRKQLDTTRMFARLGALKTVPFAEGLQATVQSFRAED